MKPHLTATSVTARPKYLVVYLNVEVGSSLRFLALKVPYDMLADQAEGLTNGMERVFTERIKADADVLYLPLEKWE